MTVNRTFAANPTAFTIIDITTALLSASADYCGGWEARFRYSQKAVRSRDRRFWPYRSTDPRHEKRASITDALEGVESCRQGSTLVGPAGQSGLEAELAANDSTQAEHACSEQEQAAWLGSILGHRNVIQSHKGRIVAEGEGEGVAACPGHRVRIL